jgi:hypothetical protein
MQANPSMIAALVAYASEWGSKGAGSDNERF